MAEKIPVVVTTEFRGVFFGFVNPNDMHDRESLTLSEARCAMYWSAETGGFLGLAATGPADGSTIGAKAPGDVLLHKITSVAKCSDEAVERWNSF